VKLLPAGPPVPYVPRERILHSVNGIISAPICLSVARFSIIVDDAGNRNKKRKPQPAVIDPQILLLETFPAALQTTRLLEMIV
jgi:hypothetical protein